MKKSGETYLKLFQKVKSVLDEISSSQNNHEAAVQNVQNVQNVT